MKHTLTPLFLLALLLSFVTESFAQSSFVARRNDNAATVLILTNGQLGSLAAASTGELFTLTTLRASSAIIGNVRIDQTTPGTTNGVVVNTGANTMGSIANITTSVTPGTGAANLGKAEDAAHTTGDTLVGIAGVTNVALATPAAVNQDYTYQALGTYGESLSTLVIDSGIATINTPIRAEDSVHVTQDAGVVAWGVVNEGAAQFAASGDYGPIATYTYGTVAADINFGLIPSGLQNGSIMKQGHAGTGYSGFSGGVSSFGTGNETLATRSATVDKYIPIAVDRAGRPIITLAAAAQEWSSCSTSNTGTSDVAIKALVASNIIHVTSISCYNTSAVASSIIFKDGTTQIYAGGISNSTLEGVGVYTAVLPVPIKTAVGADFNFAMGTTGTATTCCAAGYIGVN